MANGWQFTGDNVAAAGSLALGARRCILRVLSTYGVPAEDRRDADYRRDRYLDRQEGASGDPLAAALSAALVASSMVQGDRVPWRERLPKDATWFAATAHESLMALREALADQGIAEAAGTSSTHCRSGVLAAGLDRPDCLYDAVTMLDSWSGYLLARLDHAYAPRQLTLYDAIAASGLPCAVLTEKGGPGFPVVVTSMDAATGQVRGFPTVGFKPSDIWVRRSSWLRDNAIQGADEAVWGTLPARPEILEAAIADFRDRALPDMRHSNAHGMFVGTAAAAEAIGVTTPKLAAWLRQNGFIVQGGDGWVPAPLLGPDTVIPKKDRMGHLSWLWSPAFVEELRAAAPHISQVTITRGPARPKPAPTEKQSGFLAKLHAELDLEMPEGGYPSRKAASDAIEALLRRKKDTAHEAAHAVPGMR